MTDVFIEQCIVDGARLAEQTGANEHGVYVYFVCVARGLHVYRAAYDGMRWAPIDQGDYEA